jgi:hypothetical protein
MRQGETLAILSESLIPRFLWPSKTKIALGVWFAIKIGRALETKNGWYNTSINMTVPGHLWLELGWLGVIIGSFFVGAFYKFLWKSCSMETVSNNFTGSLLGTFMLTSIISGLGSDLQILVTILALFLITYAVSGFIRMVSGSEE